MNRLPFEPNLGRPGQVITRAAFAHALGSHIRRPAAEVAERLWPHNSVVKAAVGPATTTGAGWAAPLAITAVADYVSTLGTTSAAASLFANAIKVSLAGVGQVTLPRRTTPPTANEVQWVAEGEPVPVVQIALTGGPTLTPKKLMAQVVGTNELFRSSAAESVFTELLRESVAFSLDAAVFSDLAATTARPAGLLQGTAALAPTAGGGDTAQRGDLEKLTAAIGDNIDDVVFVAHPRQALSLRIRHPDFTVPVFGTRGVPAGTIVALDPRAVAFAFGTEPRFDASQETVIHSSDTPAQISTAGAPNSVSAPSLSMFQSDCTALKVLLPVTWALRSPGAAAWIAGATWG